MPITRLLIANRGEIAIRIARAAADLGLRSVHSRDDARSLHVCVADEVRELPGQGVGAYQDADAIVAAAKASGCDAVHPGYGFLSERADFARRCAKAGLILVGPAPAHLELFGAKARARTAAVAADVPVIRGLDRAVSLQRGEHSERGDSLRKAAGRYASSWKPCYAAAAFARKTCSAGPQSLVANSSRRGRSNAAPRHGDFAPEGS